MKNSEIQSQMRKGGQISQLALPIGEPVVHVMKERIARRADTAPLTIDLTQALVADPPPVVPADLDVASAAVHILGPVTGDFALRERVSRYRSAAFSEAITAENVIITAGANQAFSLTMLTVARPGDDIVVLSPYFFNHAMLARARGATILEVPVVEPSFQPDFDQVRKAWTPRTAAFVLTDPSNPTGMRLTPESREELQKIVLERGGILVLDETYFEFQYEPVVPAPPLSLANTILIGSFSKSLSLSGWRIGYVIAAKETIDRLIGVQDCTIIAAPTAAQLIAFAALEKRREHLTSLLPRLRTSRQRLRKALESCALIDAVHGDSGVFLWAHGSGGRKGSAVVDQLLADFGIAVVAGDAFGARDYVRLAYGTVSDAELQELEGRLRKAQRR